MNHMQLQTHKIHHGLDLVEATTFPLIVYSVVGHGTNYEAFLHTFNMKICTHKTRLEVELLCSCSLTSKVVQCNAMKFIKNLMRCVHLEDTKTLWENCNSPWWNVKGIMSMFIQCHVWWLNPFCFICHNIHIQPLNLTCIGFLKS